MIPGATFERVHAGLRARLHAGRFVLGEPLEPQHLADELNASITPVRDALQRLVGERLVGRDRAGDELGAMATLLANRDWPALRRNIAAYHKLRLKLAGELIAALHLPPS